MKLKISALQEDTTHNDWRNWAFCEDTFSNANHGLENKSSSVYEGSVECLHIDKLPIFIHPCDASILQNEVSSDQHVSQQEHSPEVVCSASLISIYLLFLLITYFLQRISFHHV